jgi:hypothetical protein
MATIKKRIEKVEVDAQEVCEAIRRLEVEVQNTSIRSQEMEASLKEITEFLGITVVNMRSPHHPQLNQDHRRNPQVIRMILAPMSHCQSTLRWTSHDIQGTIHRCGSIRWSSSLNTREQQQIKGLFLLLSTSNEKLIGGGSGCSKCTRRKVWWLLGMCLKEN